MRSALPHASTNADARSPAACWPVLAPPQAPGSSSGSSARSFRSPWRQSLKAWLRGLHHRASADCATRLPSACAGPGAQPIVQRRVCASAGTPYRLHLTFPHTLGSAAPCAADVVGREARPQPDAPSRSARRATMRQASRVAAAAAAARPQRALGQAAALATHAPTVVHPPDQSVRPGFTKDDPSHTSKWLQVRRVACGARTARCAHARATRVCRRRLCARRRTGSLACPLRRSSPATSRVASGVRLPALFLACGAHPIDCFWSCAAAGADPALGHPVEFIVLNDTSAEFPAVCKYCGNRFFQKSHAH